MYMVFKILKDLGFVKRMLVICPIRPMNRVWPHQKDMWHEFTDLKVVVLHGTKKEQTLCEDADIYVINPEGIGWLFGAKVVKPESKVPGKKTRPQVVLDPVRMAFIREWFQILCVDESTKFQDHSTIRFKTLAKAVPAFKRRYILTGSFRPKSLMGLFGQVYILDEGAALGQYITHYRNKYFFPDPHVPHVWSAQLDAPERIAKRIAPLCLVANEEGAVDLPDLLIHDVWVDLPEDCVEIYKNMQVELIALIKSGAVVAANAAVAASKCRQIANGFLFSSEERGVYTRLHTAKLEALKDLLDQLAGENVLITYEYIPDRELLAKELQIPCLSTGNAKKDDEMIRMFGAGLLPAAMGNTRSISLGIDGMQENCCTIIMYGVSWSLIDYQQVIDRIRRSGSKAKKVTVYRILCDVPIEHRAARVLGDNDSDQRSFLTMLEQLANEVNLPGL